MPIDNSADLFLTVDDVLALAECEQLIQCIESLGPTDALITTSAGFVMRPDIRNNTRVMFEDPALAVDLLARVPEQSLGRVLSS